MRTCLLFTEKQASPNASPEMNKNSTPTPSCYADTAWAVHEHIQNRWASCSFHPSGLKLAISFFRTKAKKRFLYYYVCPTIFTARHHKDMFFLPEHDALFLEFFTFTSSSYCNITAISPLKREIKYGRLFVRKHSRTDIIKARLSNTPPKVIYTASPDEYILHLPMNIYCIGRCSIYYFVNP